MAWSLYCMPLGSQMGHIFIFADRTLHQAIFGILFPLFCKSCRTMMPPTVQHSTRTRTRYCKEETKQCLRTKIYGRCEAQKAGNDAMKMQWSPPLRPSFHLTRQKKIVEVNSKWIISWYGKCEVCPVGSVVVCKATYRKSKPGGKEAHDSSVLFFFPFPLSLSLSPRRDAKAITPLETWPETLIFRRKSVGRE